VDGAAEDFNLQAEEAELASEEEEEIAVEPAPQEETIFQPQDITWEYLKGLEKISLLTPEKEVELAKRIKEGERQVKIFETKANRLRLNYIPFRSQEMGVNALLPRPGKDIG